MAEFYQYGGSNGGSYASHFTGRLTVWEKSYSVSGNYSIVGRKIELISGSSGRFSDYRASYNINVDGQTSSGNGNYTSQSYNTAQTLFEDEITVYHNLDGKKTISCSASIDFDSGSYSPGDFYMEGTLTLTNIPRYTTLYAQEGSKGVDYFYINWSTTDAIDALQYSLNGGSWVNASMNTNKSGYFYVGAAPKTTYSVKCRAKRADSQLWTEVGPISITTYDIARLTSYPSFNLGDNVTVKYTNPAGAPIQVGICDTDGKNAFVSYRTATGNSYTFNFTDDELDAFYKAIGKKNTLDVHVYVNTNNNAYRDYKKVTVTLTGNQKTGHINVNGKNKRTKRWINVNGKWKRSVRWVNVNGTWKRCI